MENLVVALLVAAAALYLGRYYWRKHSARRRGAAACGSSCSGCACGSTCRPPGEAGGKPGKALALLAAFGLAAGAPGAARAADTMETFEAGALDVELYAGYEGLGDARENHAIFGDLYLGYGIADRLSAFVGTLVHFDGRLSNPAPDVYLGVFGTPVDTAHFDLDLSLTFDALGDGLRELQLTPGLELNLDLDSPVGPWGLYLRAALPVHGGAGGEPVAVRQVDLIPGAWWSVRDGQQLLLEFATSAHRASPESDGRIETGAIALGYNLALTPALELISQVSVRLPQDDEPAAAGAMLGFIATPGAQ
ncbi:MAG: FeoB-associated Cys-rich membrane protein [Myxococcales bacterium]|jgi:hypothetical protein